MNEKNKFVQFLQIHFTAKRIAFMAIFTALSYIVSLISFPIFPQTSMLKLDFGNVFIMLSGFMFGPVEAIIVCVVKELLRIPIGSTGGVGEVANIIMTISFILIPSISYRLKKNYITAIISLIISTLFCTAVCLLVNRFINFPFFGDSELIFFNKVKHFIVLFNLIKWTAISTLTLLLYKAVENIIKKQRL